MADYLASFAHHERYRGLAAEKARSLAQKYAKLMEQAKTVEDK